MGSVFTVLWRTLPHLKILRLQAIYDEGMSWREGSTGNHDLAFSSRSAIGFEEKKFSQTLVIRAAVN
jgi:hypothetical protein